MKQGARRGRGRRPRGLNGSRPTPRRCGGGAGDRLPRGAEAHRPLQHKSDAGAIALDLGDVGAAAYAAARLMASPAAAGAKVIVERMAQLGIELFVAARSDAVVPALVVGLGGVWTEALDDVAIVPLPADPDRVEEALPGLRGAPLSPAARARLDDLGAVRSSWRGRLSPRPRGPGLVAQPAVARPRLRGGRRRRPRAAR